MWPFAKNETETGIVKDLINPKIGDWTKKAVSQVPPSTGADIAHLRKALDGINSRLSESSFGTLPIETLSVHASRQMQARMCFDKMYSKIDLGILRWRKKQGASLVPVFGVFDPFKNNNECVIVSRKRSGFSSPNELKIGGAIRISHPFSAYYRDLDSDYTYEAAFSGFIPDHVRQPLRELHGLKEGSSHSLFELLLIAECDWTIKVTPPDPLVIVSIGFEAWLVASFDTTAIENIVASEFTS